MAKFQELRVGCGNCGQEFHIQVREDKAFGEQNYKLYNRPPLTCPNCGFQERSDYNHNQGYYFFRNFENLGPVVEIQLEETAGKGVDKEDSSEGREK